MNIASMREIITIQRLYSQKDERGNPIEKWKDIYTCHAYANAATGTDVYSRHEYSNSTSGYEGSEFYGGRRILLENKIKFSIRYTKKLKNIDTTLYRCIWNDVEYNIVSVDNVQFKNNIMIITAICKDGNVTDNYNKEECGDAE